MLMIGITGVTGKLGSYMADLVDKKGMVSVHLARSPERAKVYASAEIRKMVYANTLDVSFRATAETFPLPAGPRISPFSSAISIKKSK